MRKVSFPENLIISPPVPKKGREFAGSDFAEALSRMQGAPGAVPAGQAKGFSAPLNVSSVGLNEQRSQAAPPCTSCEPFVGLTSNSTEEAFSQPNAEISGVSGTSGVEKFLGTEPGSAAVAESQGQVTETAVPSDAFDHVGGASWERIFPEHLVANGYLSVVELGKEPGIACGPSGTARTKRRAAFEHNACLASGSEPARNGAPALDVSGAAVPAVTEPESAPDDQIASGALPHLTASTLVTDPAWIRRMLRYSQDETGIRTVWVRDFALEKSEVGPLIALLKAHADREGIAVGRIMINGREVWRAAITERGGEIYGS